MHQHCESLREIPRPIVCCAQSVLWIEHKVTQDSAPDATIILVRAEERGRGFLSYLPSAASKHSISHGHILTPSYDLAHLCL